LGVVVEEEMGCCLLGFVSLTSFELGLDLSGYFLVIVKSRNAIQIVDFWVAVSLVVYPYLALTSLLLIQRKS
jgi:hypothetical protein